MAVNAYLDSVLKVLPAIQGRQIAELLEELKVAGSVRDADEYNAKLRQLSTLVNDQEPKPSFQLVRGLIWHFISSVAHNYMMTAAKNDLIAAFQQIDEIGIKIDNHHNLIMSNLISDMERGLNNQENNILRLEWLKNQSNEFSLAIVNSFRSASLLRIPRSEFGAENLYFDNRTYKIRTESELSNAVVSEHGQKLILDVTNEPRTLPVSVMMHTDSSSYGTQIQTSVNNPIENCIDGTKGTFWTRDVYLSEAVTKVNTVIEFGLGNGKDVSYIIVEGATETPFFIESIYGIAPDGHRITLSTTSTEIDGWGRIDFDRALVKSVQVTFSTFSYKKADYIVDPKANTLEIFNTSLTEQDIIEKIGPISSEVISSKNLSEILNISTGNPDTINSFLYQFALDNVWFGNGIYEDSGIFVSSPLEGTDFGILAVQSVEITSTNEDGVENSIEYEIIKKDISPLYKETKFPIPRLGSLTVNSERLVLTKREVNSTISDAGALRFCPYVQTDWAITDEEPIIIYRNGERLTIKNDFQIAIRLASSGDKLEWVDGWISGTSDTRDFDNYQLTPPKMWIKILSPDPSAVYTVNYTIRTSDTYIDDNTMWLDADKTVFLTDNGRVYCKRDNPDIPVDSKIYLQITLRRNTASQVSTPELYKYALLGATYRS